MKEPHTIFAGNDILAALPPEDAERLMTAITSFESEPLQTLNEAGSRIDHLYFPVNSVVSVMASTADGRSVEVGLIGREGFAGFDALLARETAANQNVMQIGSRCYRMNREAALQEFERCGAFQTLCLEFIHRLMTQISQTALCNRLHTLEERLSRWLLMCDDRVRGDELPLTQEVLAFMVGSTRTSVSTAATHMQDIGVISYRRGIVTIKDRERLEKSACDCYQTLKQLDRR